MIKKTFMVWAVLQIVFISIWMKTGIYMNLDAKLNFVRKLRGSASIDGLVDWKIDVRRVFVS